jgi:hypothetical protein
MLRCCSKRVRTICNKLQKQYQIALVIDRPKLTENGSTFNITACPPTAQLPTLTPMHPSHFDTKSSAGTYCDAVVGGGAISFLTGFFQDQLNCRTKLP